MAEPAPKPALSTSSGTPPGAAPPVRATDDPFAAFTPLGNLSSFAEQLFKVSEHTQLFEEFSLDEIAIMGPHMQVYRAEAGQAIISEGDTHDFLVVLLDGMVDVIKRDREGQAKRIAVVVAGQSLGEMSMIDGEPRFATCVAVEPTTFAELSRSEIQLLLDTQPKLAAKIMLKLIFLLAGRLRQTSVKLVNAIEGPPPAPPKMFE